MKMKIFGKAVGVFYFIFISIASSSAQVPPGTDIFLVNISVSGSNFKIDNLINISRRPGYDNQPLFTPDGKSILYTSIREDNQADTYLYDIDRNSGYRFYFTTPEAEYSPTMMPDGNYYSAIRVEADGAQRLWKFPYFSDGVMEVIFENIRPVGYHIWIDDYTAALFVLGDQSAGTPVTLQIADTRTGRGEIVAENIGHALKMIPGKQAVSVVQKVSPGDWYIIEYDLTTKSSSNIIKTLPNQEDFCWHPNGTILMGNGSKLFKYTPGTDNDWVETFDFSGTGIDNISRLASSPDGSMLLIVSGG